MIAFEKPHNAGDVPGHTAVKKDRSDYVIHKVIQAIDLLEQFHDEVDELSMSELIKRLDMHPKSGAMLIATLKARNYIEQNSHTNNYRLGLKALELAQSLLRRSGIHRVSHQVLAEIAQACGETTAVAVLSKSLVVEIDAVQSELPVQVVPRVGVHLPVHCTAAGKVQIACGSDQARDALFQGGELERYTPNTICGPDELRRHLAGIRDAGYAVDDGELDREVRSVAAVIRDYDGRVVGALAITGPSCRITYDRLRQELIPLVQLGAREISSRLGYHEVTPCDPAVASDAALRRIAAPRAAAGKRRPAGTPRAA